MRVIVLAIAVALATTAPTIALGQEAGGETAPERSRVSGFVTLGAAVVPDFEGSEDQTAAPLLAGRLAWERFSIASSGTALKLGFAPAPGFTIGSRVGFRFGRDDDVENEVVSRLRDIDDAIEFGGFIDYRQRVGLMRGDFAGLSLDVSADVSGAHDGVIGSLGAVYSFAPTDRWRVNADAGVTAVTEAYADTFFSVDADNAERSGLREYEAEGGVHSLSLGLTATYSLTSHWGVSGRAGYSRLVGDAADSPIVEDEGTPNQFFLGAGVTYQF